MFKENLFATIVFFVFSLSIGAQKTQIIAHRGYWNTTGSAQNSISSLKNAYKLGCYGSEFDVHITTDGVIVVNHNDDVGNINIETHPYSDIKDCKLANGEKLCTLKQYLKTGKKLKGMQMILEIKMHQTAERENRCVDGVVDMVKKFKMQKQVEYISFSSNVCKRLAKETPNSRISYLGKNLSPSQCKGMGCTGIDNDIETLRSHPDWIHEAHDLGMYVNVWTIETPEEAREFIVKKADFLTTNIPALCLKMVK